MLFKKNMYFLFSGHSNDAPTKDYTVTGSKENRIFGTFNAISIIATSLASGIIPEIQVLFSSLNSFALMRGDERKLGKRSTIRKLSNIAGNNSTSSTRKDVQRPMCVLQCDNSNIFQCGYFWILGIWQSV